MDKDSEVMLKKLSVENGCLDLELEGGACQILAETFIDQFKDNNAKNYLEVGFYNKETGPITVTIQRVNGLTPAGKLNKIKELIRAGDIESALAV